MKKIILLLGLQLCFLALQAQYSLQPIIPTKGIIQKANLWNVLLMNNSQSAITGRLELILRDRNTGMEQITATSNQVTIEKGAKQLNNTLLAPIQYNFFADGFLRQSQDLIPIGNYIACYRFSNPLGKGITFAEECVQFDIEPLSPPMLVTPNNNAELPIQPTQFSWTAPTPLGLFNQLKYDVIVVEVLADQKPEEAIQQNFPIYTENNTPNNFINYKGSKLTFQKDKLYAWQVVAKDNNEYAAKSEVWEFRVGDNGISKEKQNEKFLILGEDVNGSYEVNKQEIKIRFFSNRVNDEKAKVIIQNYDGKQIISQSIKIVNGYNYYTIKLNKKTKYGQFKLVIDSKELNIKPITFTVKEN